MIRNEDIRDKVEVASMGGQDAEIETEMIWTCEEKIYICHSEDM